MCLGHPKRLRSASRSKVHPRFARTKPVQDVQLYTSMHRAVAHGTHALQHACKLPSASKAGSQSTLNPGTDHTRLRHKACTSSSPSSHSSLRSCARIKTCREAAQAPQTASSAAGGDTCARSAPHRLAWTIHGGSRAARRHDRQEDLRGLSNARQQLLAGGSRPQIDGSESILSTVRREVRRTRRSSS